MERSAAWPIAIVTAGRLFVGRRELQHQAGAPQSIAGMPDCAPFVYAAQPSRLFT